MTSKKTFSFVIRNTFVYENSCWIVFVLKAEKSWRLLSFINNQLILPTSKLFLSFGSIRQKEFNILQNQFSFIVSEEEKKYTKKITRCGCVDACFV